jgi:hypothetical protein
MDEDGKIILEPKTILETWIKQLHNQIISKHLIKWKNMPIEDAMWEDEFFMLNHP